MIGDPQLEIPGAEAPPLAPPLEPARKRGRPPGSTNKPKAAPPPNEPPDKETIAAAWRGLFFVIKIVAGWFGFEAIEMDDAGQLPAEEAREDAKSLRLIPGLASLTFLSWIAAPVVVLQRLTQHFRRKAPTPPRAAPAPAPAAPAAPPTPAVALVENGKS